MQQQPTQSSGAPPQGYAPPPPGYGYPPPMPIMPGESIKYPKTQEERTGCMACLVWPLAIAACLCTGLALIGFIPLFLACEFPIVRKKNQRLSKFYPKFFCRLIE